MLFGYRVFSYILTRQREGERARELSGVPFIRAVISFMKVPLSLSNNPLSWSFYVMSFAHFSIQMFVFSVVICKYSLFINNIFHLLCIEYIFVIKSHFITIISIPCHNYKGDRLYLQFYRMR